MQHPPPRLLLLLCLLLSCACSAEAGTLTMPPAPSPLDAPIQVTTQDGASVNLLQQERAPLLLVHFWATWCPPCIKELPEIDALARRWQYHGLKLVTIAVDTPSAARRFLAINGLSHLNTYYDTDQTAFTRLQLPGLPSSLFVDANGNEIARITGVPDWKSEEIAKFISSFTEK